MPNVPITIGLIVLAWLGVPSLWRFYGERRLQKACHSRGAVCLTFDDGPGEEMTQDLLELLGRYQARATFFMLGRRAAEQPELAQAVHARGHQLASHSYDHLHAWKYSPWRIWSDVAKGRTVVEGIAGARVAFRPPYGKLTLANWVQTACFGRDLGWWTHDSGDTHAHLPAKDSILSDLRESGGGVVLLHDFDQGRDNSRKEYVLDLTGAILELAVEQGWKALSMGDLMNCIEGQEADA